MDSLGLSQKLISCKSVTPIDDGAIGTLADYLSLNGFECNVLEFNTAGVPIQNLYARFGKDNPNFCFAGHTDVVPVGDEAAWKYDPFGAEVHNEVLYGRGAVDMKAAIACFSVAACEFIKENKFKGSISLLITGDEEAVAVDGTVKVLEWLRERNEQISACLIGEPSSCSHFGDRYLIGRRGSINFDLEVKGIQGHVAYPDNFHNPITDMLKMLTALKSHKLDEGNKDFEPSNLEFTDLLVGNKATNVVPAKAHAKFNIRYNDFHTGTSLENLIRNICLRHGNNFTLEAVCNGDSFITRDQRLKKVMEKSIQTVLGSPAKHSTFGGTSDGRFIVHDCPSIIEFGMMCGPAHQVDEHVSLQDINRLTKIYKESLINFFKPS